MSDAVNKPTLVNFPINTINDIPARLRDLADLLEDGTDDSVHGLDDTEVFVWINVSSAGTIESGALGKCHSPFMAAGIMLAAANQLALGETHE